VSETLPLHRTHFNKKHHKRFEKRVKTLYTLKDGLYKCLCGVTIKKGSRYNHERSDKHRAFTIELLSSRLKDVKLIEDPSSLPVKKFLSTHISSNDYKKGDLIQSTVLLQLYKQRCSDNSLSPVSDRVLYLRASKIAKRKVRKSKGVFYEFNIP
jgi:predicted adenine nucleotide alpha hydrolase (AANH) superfamily ATPase